MSRDEKTGRRNDVADTGAKPRRRSIDARPLVRRSVAGGTPAAQADGSATAAERAVSGMPAVAGLSPRRPAVLLPGIFLLACAIGGASATFVALAYGIGR